MELLVKYSNKSGFVVYALGYSMSNTDSEHGRRLVRKCFPNNSTNCKHTPKQMDLCFCFRFPTQIEELKWDIKTGEFLDAFIGN